MAGILTLDGTLWLIIARTFIVYIFVIAGLRLFGKRELGQLNTFDLVLLLLIANTVQNAMTGPDTSLNGGILAAIVLMLMNYLFSWLNVQFVWFRHAVSGVPTVLINHGTLNQRGLQREDITHEELHAALREHGVDQISDVALAVLEIDGSISVLTNDAGEVSTIEKPKLRHVHTHTRQ